MRLRGRRQRKGRQVAFDIPSTGPAEANDARRVLRNRLDLVRGKLNGRVLVHTERTDTGCRVELTYMGVSPIDLPTELELGERLEVDVPDP